MSNPPLREPFWLIKFKLLHLLSHMQIFFSIPISPSTFEQSQADHCISQKAAENTQIYNKHQIHKYRPPQLTGTSHTNKN